MPPAVGRLPFVGAFKSADEAADLAQALGKNADDMMGASGDAFKYGDDAFKLDDDIFEFDEDVLKLSDDTGSKIDGRLVWTRYHRGLGGDLV